MERVTAQLSGYDTIAFAGHTVRHRTPILAACRMVAKDYPDAILDVYRGATPVCSWPVSKAAKLTVIENEKFGPSWGKYKPFDCGIVFKGF